ncbi:MAG: DUF5309 family protein [Planctomycetota bacterium]
MTATFGTSSELSAGMASLVYQQSYGNLAHGTVILDKLNGIDNREEAKASREEFKSALTTQSPLFATGTYYSATSGSIPVLLPTVVDAKLYDTAKKATPLASGVLARVANQGMYADYIIRSAYQTAVWNPEDAALTAEKSTYSRAVKAIKFAYAPGKITGPMLVASKVWQNALNLEVEAAYKALKFLEEDTIINGDTTSSTYTHAFNGLIATNSTNYQNKSSGELTFSDIDAGFQKIRESRGHPNLCVTDWRTFNSLKQLIRPIMIMQTGGLTAEFGFEEVKYEGILIVPDLFMPTTATAREFLILDTATENNIQVRTLQDATFQELANTNDSYNFMVKEYITLLVINEAWTHRIYNLA